MRVRTFLQTGNLEAVPLSSSGSARTPMAAGLTVPVWATDDAKYSSGSNAPRRNPPPPVILHWSKYRGPGEVTFDKVNPPFENLQGDAAFSGKATVTTTAVAKVTVTP